MTITALNNKAWTPELLLANLLEKAKAGKIVTIAVSFRDAEDFLQTTLSAVSLSELSLLSAMLQRRLAAEIDGLPNA